MHREKKLIYLLDLAHTQTVQDASIPVPLGIGYIAAYLDQIHGDNVEVKLFKHPEKALANIIKDQPAIVGFANYGWNQSLNQKIGRYIRSILPDSLLVAGGPNIDNDTTLRTEFLEAFDFIDYAIINGGEEPFSDLVTWWSAPAEDKPDIPKNLIWLEQGELRASPERHLKKKIENIPSPYLGGYLDEFLESGMIPLFETNRGCPFTCTFCAWGMASHNLVRRFELDVALEEIAYVGARTTARNWIFCDANFGILKRDVEIAHAIRKNKDTYGYPTSCHIWLAKNTTDRNLEIAEILQDMVVPSMAVQSMDDEVLKNIKRDNIALETYTEYHKKFHSIGSLTYSDMIVPLPAETLESHMKGIEYLMDIGVDIIMNHNMRLLAGAETNTHDTRQKFGFKTKYRLIHGDAGIYKTPSGQAFQVFEYEESLRQTDTMTEEEVFYLRKLHFLVDFCWNLDVYKPLLKEVQSFGVNPLTLLKKLIPSSGNEATLPPSLQDFWQEFERGSHDEWFGSRQEIEAYFAKEDNFTRLVNQEFEKLNILSSIKILQLYKNDFDRVICDVAKAAVPGKDHEIDGVMCLVSASFPALDYEAAENIIELSDHFTRTVLNEDQSNDLPTTSQVPPQVRFFEGERCRIAKSIIMNSKGKTLSKILNTQGIGLGDLKYSIDEGFGFGREAKCYFQPRN
ncbi:MAG: hypothetical protein COB54_06675 [Alphaproteobacteria bacterium]|nr:MAG: hypothetical protein COB54_06675 [Alphaproteobacteria bacterium]